MSGSETKPFRILAVDDERPILELYRQLLSPAPGLEKPASPSGDSEEGSRSLNSSFEVILCQQGEEAVEAVQAARDENNPFALVFLDILMPPGPDGAWTAAQIRKVDPEVNIVLVTGHSGYDLGEISRRVPPPHKLLYLRKPFHHQEIRQFATALCAKWQTERQFRKITANLESEVDKRTSALVKANERLRMEILNRNRIEEALRTSEERLRNIITSTVDGIIILDEQGTMLFMNPAAESLWGRKAEECRGQVFGLPVITEERTELDIISGKGRTSVAEMRMVKTEWEGKTAYLASLRDITERKNMERQIQENLERLEQTMRGTVQAMATTVERRDPYTAGHQHRVAALSQAMATEMGFSSEQTDRIFLAALIHDLGKIAVPAEILSKPGRLTEVEFELIQTHAQVGYDIVKNINFPWPLGQIVLQHHERMDGSGYPAALSGQASLREARILSVADVVEAMASHRPYRPALGIKTALEEISKSRGTLYDPEVVEACLRLFREQGFDFSASP